MDLLKKMFGFQIEPLEKIKAVFSECNNRVVIDIYARTDHGFAFPSRSTYVKICSKKHWKNLFDLFERN